MEKRDDSGRMGKPPYTCSNPNCGNVFSIPKVIKYYVCPLCQTLVEMSTNGGSTLDEEYSPVEEPQAKKPITKTVHTHVQACPSQDPKSEESKLVEPKLVETKSLEQKPIEPRILAPKLEQPKPPPPTSKVALGDKKEDKTSDQSCRYYLGYLSQRNKGEGIPGTCVECNKSLDCMLTEYYKSEDTVAEIKKWYHPKL